MATFVAAGRLRDAGMAQWERPHAPLPTRARFHTALARPRFLAPASKDGNRERTNYGRADFPA